LLACGFLGVNGHERDCGLAPIMLIVWFAGRMTPWSMGP
jgi:hypothetical protein